MANDKKLTKHFISLSIVVGGLLLLITAVSVLSYVYATKRESAFHVSKVVEGMLKAHQYREAIYALSNAKLGSFDAIGYYDFEGNPVFVLPPSVGPDYFKENGKGLNRLFTTTIPVDIDFDEAGQNRAGKIFYAYNNTNAVSSIFLVWVIGLLCFLPVFYKYKTLIKSGIERDILDEKNRGIKETVRQVWHDLNQPMQFLYALAESGKDIGDFERDKIKSSCDDMRSILDDLKEKKNKLGEGKTATICLAAAIKEIVEKENLKLSKMKMTVKLSITKDGLSAFSDINESDLKRILGNIIDNAAHASTEGDTIQVTLEHLSEMNIVRVTDQGHGIKLEQLSQIGKRGVSFRTGGNGLGLSYAISKVESWGGRLEIESVYQQGTTVTVKIPSVAIPEWFTAGMALDGAKEFILTDDRADMHLLVQDALKENHGHLEKYFHQTSEEFETWFLKNKNALHSPVFVFDYDLGQDEKTGIDLIEEFGLQANSILMTNFHDDAFVQAKVMKAGVRMFPKALVEFVGG
ncbi:MAG: HAMP domain-containing histidine kinase [Bdellovibrio sp.]|nr:HAMP domain-containing histidine kinase [Bdellovibrio sp.]